jgi:uncharacterized cupredoxin-like copper-binding protein
MPMGGWRKTHGRTIECSATAQGAETALFTPEDSLRRWCTIEGHYTFGMVGTLTVTP